MPRVSIAHTKHCPKARVCEKLRQTERKLAVALKKIDYLQKKLLEANELHAKQQEKRLQC